MLKFSLAELSQLAQSDLVLAGAVDRESLGCVRTDSRAIEQGDIYLALSGEKFDGHNFAIAALKSGASMAIIDVSWLERLAKDLPDGKALLPVNGGTLSFYQDIALHARRKYSGQIKVIGVTGSSGKTTTKEMLGAVFSARRAHKSAANENNEIGVPKTILSMPEDCEFLILEMGMRGLGQIAELAACSLPDIGIITSIGSTHIELLGSLENIAIAKCELYASLENSSPRGVAICGQFTKLARRVSMEVYKGIVLNFDEGGVKIESITASGTTFTCEEDLHSQKYFLRAHGDFLLRDAWCAVVAARHAGLLSKEIAEGLASWQPVEGRGNLLELSSGTLIVDETYNANPESVRCAVEALLTGDNFRDRKKVVILGKMAELGDFTESLHKDLGNWLKDKPIDLLVTMGEVAALIGEGASGGNFSISNLSDLEETFSFIRKLEGERPCIMLKGSHSTNMHELIKRLI